MKKDVFYYDIRKIRTTNKDRPLACIKMVLKVPYIYNLLSQLSESDLNYMGGLIEHKKWTELDEVLSKYPIPHVSDALLTLTANLYLSRKYQSWKPYKERYGTIRIEHNCKFKPIKGMNLLRNPTKFFESICKSRNILCRGKFDLSLYMSLYYWEKWQNIDTT